MNLFSGVDKDTESVYWIAQQLIETYGYESMFDSASGGGQAAKYIAGFNYIYSYHKNAFIVIRVSDPESYGVRTSTYYSLVQRLLDDVSLRSEFNFCECDFVKDWVNNVRNYSILDPNYQAQIWFPKDSVILKLLSVDEEFRVEYKRLLDIFDLKNSQVLKETKFPLNPHHPVFMINDELKNLRSDSETLDTFIDLQDCIAINIAEFFGNPYEYTNTLIQYFEKFIDALYSSYDFATNFHEEEYLYQLFKLPDFPKETALTIIEDTIFEKFTACTSYKNSIGNFRYLEPTNFEISTLLNTGNVQIGDSFMPLSATLNYNFRTSYLSIDAMISGYQKYHSGNRFNYICNGNVVRVINKADEKFLIHNFAASLDNKPYINATIISPESYLGYTVIDSYMIGNVIPDLGYFDLENYLIVELRNIEKVRKTTDAVFGRDPQSPFMDQTHYAAFVCKQQVFTVRSVSVTYNQSYGSLYVDLAFMFGSIHFQMLVTIPYDRYSLYN